jgi:hypothetical protein
MQPNEGRIETSRLQGTTSSLLHLSAMKESESMM